MKKLIFLAFASVFLVACGGSGSGNNNSYTPPPTATGIFKDANVVGIEYVSGSQSGTTTMAGEFIYEVGNNVRFLIGGITLLETAGKAVITPADFDNNNLTSTKTINIGKILAYLDTDGNADNGITISTQTVSSLNDASISTSDVDNNLNFSDNTDFNNFLSVVTNTIINAGTATLGFTATPMVRSDESITMHLRDTTLCAYSGAFSGTYDWVGDGNGGDPLGQKYQQNLGFVIDANGAVSGIEVEASYTLADRSDIMTLSTNTLTNLSTLAFGNGSATFVTEYKGSGDDNGWFYTAKYPSNNLNEITDIIFTDRCHGCSSSSGASFTLTRLNPSDSAEYRFTALASPITSVGNGEYGILTFDIGNNNLITGLAYSLVDNATFTLSGTYTMDNQLLEVEIEQNDAFTTASATINLNTGVMSNGMWNDGDGESGVLVGSGCRLN